MYKDAYGGNSRKHFGFSSDQLTALLRILSFLSVFAFLFVLSSALCHDKVLSITVSLALTAVQAIWTGEF